MCLAVIGKLLEMSNHGIMFARGCLVVRYLCSEW